MSKRRWEAPVLVICKRSGRMHMVTTTEEALNILLNAWPVSTGKAFLRALQVCADVDAGLRTPHEARECFIAAAQEADIPIETAGPPVMQSASRKGGAYSAPGLREKGT
ncbi:hypothetical protein FHX08_004760 [Rhizobium sp. BK529]|uniref:DUF982 domain-containing protein n=1 Tax=Rhizobium sp. BK529 TaxID=2586983 RepID=UPI00160F04B7|nr:DUF982 domain-containing protein [Rhizobium sp. BK529]MBB3594356.1 hypothetical protein [Rhizobium sp. BK529]